MKITVYKKFRFFFLALPRPHYWCRNRTTTSSLLSTAMVDTSNLEYACNVHMRRIRWDCVSRLYERNKYNKSKIDLTDVIDTVENKRNILFSFLLVRRHATYTYTLTRARTAMLLNNIF